MENGIYLGDNLELLKQLPDNSIDSCVSDFPYNLGFMGKKWDTISNYYQWCNERAVELFRVLKPGAFCLIFSGTRTQHRMVCGFEDAGFEIKDQIMWVYGQGFPKSYNISKGFDKQAGVKGEVIGEKLLWGHNAGSGAGSFSKNKFEGQTGITRSEDILAPATDLAKQWEGYGTALKPTHEPIMVAQKPIEKNYCYNVEKWGVGGLNINGSRIELNGEIVPINVLEKWSGFGEENRPDYIATNNEKGRYPANTIFDEEAGIELNNQNNGVSRFFFCAKASQKDRSENGQIENIHPTVKPTSLMMHLIKMVTPPNGINIDICEGSGASAKACLLLKKEGYPVDHIGFENDIESYKISLERIELNKI